MRLGEVARFEIASQFRRAATWIYFAIFLALAFAATASLVDDARQGSFFFNAPILIAGATVLTSLIGLLIMAGVSGDAATRDLQTRMAPLVYATAIDKTSYVGGRFLGAFAVSALLLLVVPFGLALLTQLPALEAQLVGPFQPLAYLGAYLFVALPNAFIVTAILFSVATFTRRAMSSLVAAAMLFLVTLLSRELVAEVLGKWELAKQLDPSAFTIISAMWRTWTPAQKNAMLVPLDGALLTNRLLWMGIAVALLALTHWRFRFAHTSSAGARAGRDAGPPAGEASASRPPGRRHHCGPVRQTLALALYAYRDILTSRTVFVLPLLAAFLVFVGGELMEVSLGTPSVPTTARVLPLFGNIMVTIIIGVLTTLYAGELVWKERDARMDALADVAPVPDRVTFLGKFLALALVLGTVQAVLAAAGITMQAMQGYTDFEPGLYLRVLFGLRFADALLFAVLALAVHVLVNQKYLGHVISFLAFLSMTFAGELGIEHKLLIYGSDPGWSYSDMNGFGASLGPWLWLKLFWAAWGLLLAVIAHAFWVRGTERRVRFTRASVATAAAAVIAIAAIGGFVFYNTNVRNEYRTAADKVHDAHARAPQPLLTGTKLHVELYPQRHAFAVRGTYRLENRTAQPIDRIHVVTNRDAETSVTGIGRKVEDHVYALDRPLQSGETIDMHLDVRLEPRGFTNRGVRSPVADNGTNFDPKSWLPFVGYPADDDAPARSLNDVAARRDTTDRERIDFEAVVGTDAGQSVVAPGALRRTWTSNGRRYFHYVTDAPIRNIYAFFSARYAVREARWKNVAIQVFHHPGHAANVERIIRGAQASLEYCTKNFGPYPYAQLRFVEFPRNSMLLRAYPGTIMYSEAFAVVNPTDDARHLDLPFAVIAHEIAHQWWGHQIVPADVEGAPVLTESLAWYSAMMVVEKTYGEDHLARLLDMMRREYLTPRSKAGVPLLRATDHFDVYRKGPFAMYGLRDAAGEENVNAALRALLARYGAGEPPFPTSLDLYAQLRAVAPHAAVADLFATNTFWELQTDTARAARTQSGQWRVTLDVRARKTHADTTGKETEVAMNDLVDVGVYSADDRPLYLRKHRVHSGRQTITVTVPREPARAGVDPNQVLIETKREDNVRDVEAGSTAP